MSRRERPEATMRRTMTAALALTAILCLAAPAAAENWANRWGFSIGGGGVTSSAGTGAEFNVGVTYYLNNWVQFTLSPGFGAYPMSYEYATSTGSNVDTAYVKEVPVNFAVIVTPYRWGRVGIFVGPGVGFTYFWWTQKEQDPNNLAGTVNKDEKQVLYSAFATAGVSYHFSGPFVGTIGVTYTMPDVKDWQLKNAVLTYGIGGGVAF
jgi:hypothetical protein